MIAPDKPVYLDYNATTPHDPEVIAAMRPYLEEHFGNPSSAHWYGQAPRAAVAEARSQVAALLNCRPEEILFTSGGTESNNQAIRGAALSRKKRGRHIITSRIEHPAVIEVCRRLEGEGFETTYLPVDHTGMIRPAELESAICPETILVTLMHANNEVGTIQPLREAARIARARGILFHTDAAQSAGKIPVDVEELGVDLLTIAGHKIYAPKGVGALFVRQGVMLERFMDGAGQEVGRRAGTENVLEIAGLGKACEIAKRDLAPHMAQMEERRNALECKLRERIADLRVNGHPMMRLPNTLSVSIRGLNANDILSEVGQFVAASAGAACHSGEVRMSHVLEAMAVPEDWARGTLRLTTGRFTTAAEIEMAAEAIIAGVERLRESQGRS